MLLKILDTGPSDFCAGSSLKGYMRATYEEVVSCFGNPTAVMGDKTTVEWDVEIRAEDDDEVEYSIFATIYDWKRNSRYAPEGEYEWHIGGWSEDALHAVTLAMENYRKVTAVAA